MMVTVMDSSRDTLPMTVGSSNLSSDDDDDCLSSPGSPQFGDHAELMAAAMGDEVTAQLAAAGWQNVHGPVGMAAAAAIVSSKKRKRPHSFETNPSIRKRQQNRLLRKLRQTIEEFATRVGQQAVVLVATPGKPNPSFKCFGAKPLEDVVRNLKGAILDELEIALAQQAPPPNQDDPTLYELPPLIIDGIPTPVEKMTQAQLRAFIPLMLKYSTGRGKPGWGRESTRPLWWPKELPWANVRMDARTEEEKQKISWTHALRQIVINCYKYHGREDLLPAFTEEDERSMANGGAGSPVGLAPTTQASTVNSTQTPSSSPSVGVLKFHPSSKSVASSPGASSPPSSSSVSVVTNTNTITSATQSVTASSSTSGLGQAQVTQYAPTVLQTISNPDGTMSFIPVDPNSPIITLSDGTTAHVQGVATITDHADGTVHTVQTLEVGSPDGVTLDLNNVAEATLINQDGQLILTGEDGHEYAVKLCNVDKLWQGHGAQLDKNPRAASSHRSSGHTPVPVSLRTSGYPVGVSGMITVPVPASMYQTMVANIQTGDGTMQMVPVPKVEPVSGGGTTNVETISVQPGMHQIMTMNGSEPQVVHVFSLKDTNSLSKAISSDMKVEDTNEVISPD